MLGILRARFGRPPIFPIFAGENWQPGSCLFRARTKEVSVYFTVVPIKPVIDYCIQQNINGLEPVAVLARHMRNSPRERFIQICLGTFGERT